MADKKEDDVAQLNAIKMALRMGHSLLKYQVEFLVAMTERAIATPPADAALADELDEDADALQMMAITAIPTRIRNAAAALRARGAVAEGFVMVPVTPSVEMLEAGFWAQCEATRESIKDMWAAMLAASKRGE